MTMSLLLSLPDLALLLCSLSLPLLLTCILCLVQRQHATVSQYLMADRQLSVLPAAVSLAVSFISVNSALNMSQDISTFSIMLPVAILLSSTLGMAIIPNMFMSVFYKMHMTSVYEYLELRFNSSLVRRLVSVTVSVATQLFLGVVLLTTCDGVSVITGIPSFPYIVCGCLLPLLVLPCGGLVCVVWTGVWQAVVVIAGSTGVVGSGWQDVSMERASVGWSPDTHDILHTLAMCSGQIILWASVSGCHQVLAIRYSASKSATQARWMLGVTIFCYWLLSIGVVLSVMVIITKYQQSGQNMEGVRLEQAVLFFSSQVLSKAPGLTGLLVSAVVAASLSTISSLTHSLAASVWEDFMYQSRWAETSSQSECVLAIRVIKVMSGIITLLLAYCYSHLEQALHLATAAPLVLSGPLLAVFMMGFFVPFANNIGVTIGMVSGLALPIWMAVGAALTNMDQNKSETSVEKALDFLYKMTDLLYPLIGFTVTLLVGISCSLLSHLFISTRPPPHLLIHPCARKKDTSLNLTPIEHAWNTQDAHHHYLWPSPSLPPTLKKPRPSVDTLTINRKGGLVDTINRRRRKEDNWRSNSLTSGYDNDCFDSLGEEGGGRDLGTWESERSVNYI